MSRIDGSGQNITLPPWILPQTNKEEINLKELAKIVHENLVLLGDNDDKNIDDGTEGGGRGPQLPPPDTHLDNASLSSLLLKLQMKTDELQLNECKEFIKGKKTELEKKNQERVKKMEDAAKKAEKADKAGKIGKIIGYIGLAVTAVVAVAACVATGGLAVGPVTCFLLAGAMVLMDETGATGKIIQGMEKGLEDLGVGKKTAMWIAMGVFIATVLVVSGMVPDAATEVAGAIADLSKGRLVLQEVEETDVLMTASTAEKLRAAEEAGTISRTRLMAQRIGESAKLAEDTSTTAGAVSGGISSYYQSQSLNMRAQVKDMEKFIAAIQQKMEDEKDRMQQIIQQMQSNISVVLSILKSQRETNEVISRQSI